MKDMAEEVKTAAAENEGELKLLLMRLAQGK